MRKTLSSICECELDYKDFRTGYTFTDIRRMLKRESKVKYNKGEYMFISRATVLGRWHELKQVMWRDFIKGLETFGCSKRCQDG